MKWLTALIDLSQQLHCLVKGHSGHVERQDGAQFVRCHRCFGRSPGWAAPDTRPIRTYAGDPARFRMVQQPVPVVPYHYGPVLVSQDTAVLAATLHGEGRHEEVSLLLMPSKSDRIQ